MSGFTKEFAHAVLSVTHRPFLFFRAGVTRCLPRTNYRHMAPTTSSPGSGRRSCDREADMAISLSMSSPAFTATSPTDRATDGLSATEIELRERFVRGLAGDATQYRHFLDRLGAHLRAYLRRRLPRAPR